MALAGIFYTTQQTISAWEKRLKESDFGMLIAIAKFFEVSIEYLLGLED